MKKWIIRKLRIKARRFLYKYDLDYKNWVDSEFYKARNEARKLIMKAYGVTPIQIGEVLDEDTDSM